MALGAPAQQTLEALTGLEGLAGVPWDQLGPSELPGAAAALARAKAIIEGALVAVAGELEDTDAATRHGWASAKDFLTAQLGGFKGTGGGYVRLAGQTRRLPAVQAALVAGDLSVAQARVIAGRVSTLPRAEQLRADAAERMLTLAPTFDIGRAQRLAWLLRQRR